MFAFDLQTGKYWRVAVCRRYWRASCGLEESGLRDGDIADSSSGAAGLDVPVSGVFNLFVNPVAASSWSFAAAVSLCRFQMARRSVSDAD